MNAGFDKVVAKQIGAKNIQVCLYRIEAMRAQEKRIVECLNEGDLEAV